MKRMPRFLARWMDRDHRTGKPLTGHEIIRLHQTMMGIMHFEPNLPTGHVTTDIPPFMVRRREIRENIRRTGHPDPRD